jgi:PLP dependent protein
MFEELLRDSIPRVREAIAGALLRAGRQDSVRLIAVTKGQPLEAVEAAVRAGLRELGENRVQELESKRAAYPADAESPTWHLIGHLQRNKVRRALALSDMIQSVDSLRLAAELSREAVRAGFTARILVQVNVAGEATKGGFDAAGGVEAIARVVELPGLRCEGLMTIAPFVDDEAVLRSTFAATRRLLEQCMAAQVPLTGRELSMGMSHDFRIAIEEGSTMVRLGTILFGERE